MATLILKPKLPRPHRAGPRSDPYYGYGYRPDWPSILSVAHDTTDGGALFVYTDRPCALAGAGNVIPLSVAGLSVLSGAVVNPICFRFVMNGAVPQGAAWQWGTGSSELYDAVTGHGPNAGAGDCADVPGPYTPPPPANVVAAYAYGESCALQFDVPIVLTGAPPDDAMLFGGGAPTSISQPDAYTLAFGTSVYVSNTSPWYIQRQPAWVATLLQAGQSGIFS